MSYANYGQPQEATQQTVEYEKKTRKVFTGRLTRDPVVRMTNNGSAVVNVDFAIENEHLETGTQFAKMVFWGEEAYIVAKILKNRNNFVGSGIVKWNEWTTDQGELRKDLEYEYPSIHPNLEQLKDFIRIEIAAAMGLQQQQQPAPVQQQPAPQTTPPTPAPTATPTVEQEFGDKPLQIDSDELPF